MKKVLIIGNGIAGTTAAETIRKQDKDAEIVIVTDEDMPFYYRIRLPEFIIGDLDEQKLLAKTPHWYSEQRILLKTATTITTVLPEKQAVVTAAGEILHYDVLLLACGSYSFVPPIVGTKGNVWTLRNIADARNIKRAAGEAASAICIGGGLLGLEAGYALIRKGLKVQVVEFFPRLLPRQLDAQGAGLLQAKLEGMGFFFHLDAVTESIDGGDAVSGVTLQDGTKLSGEMVLISAGVRPHLELARQLGLQCDKGVMVNDRLQTSRPEIYAAGDVIQWQGMVYGIWPAALQQGKIAGMNIAGGEARYTGTTMENRLKVVGVDLASAGDIDAEGRLEAKTVLTDAVYKKIVIRDNTVVGCIMLGDTTNFQKITRAMAEKQDADKVLKDFE